jgi:2-keto-4-pentenoate hydratase/2-oxohepta-3-ene-1,7-dioic acid hydratase in catechol pathway
VRDVTAALESLPTHRYPYPRGDAFIAALSTLKPALASVAAASPPIPLAQISLQSPVANPGKLVAAPVNYLAHLQEAIAEPQTYAAAHVRRIEETGLFLKAPSSLIGVGRRVVINRPSRRTDHEIELAVVIGSQCKNATRETALSHVAGYCIGLDITLRGPEERSLRKSIDSYSVLGPWLVTADELTDPSALDMSLEVNGEPRQRANTRDLILDIPALIVFASSYYTLESGDIIYTGTPEGVGPIKAGDSIHATIGQIGSIDVRVVAE